MTETCKSNLAGQPEPLEIYDKLIATGIYIPHTISFA